MGKRFLALAVGKEGSAKGLKKRALAVGISFAGIVLQYTHGGEPEGIMLGNRKKTGLQSGSVPIIEGYGFRVSNPQCLK